MEYRHLSVSVSFGTLVKVLIVVAAAWAFWQLSTLVLMLLSAIVIASAVEPGVEFFLRRKFPRPLAVVLVYALIIALLVMLVWFFIPPMLAEAIAVLAVLPQYASQVSNLTSLPFLEGTVVGPSFTESIVQLQNAFVDTGAGVLQFVSSIFGGAVYFLLTMVVSIYFSLQETGIDDFLRLVTPAKHRDYILGLWKRSQKKIGLWMQGQILLSVIITVLLFLGLSLLGVQYALLLAIFAGVMELIPVFGSLVAAVPGILVALISGDLTLAVVVAGLYLIVNQFQAHLIYPLVVKKIVGVPPIIVIIALLAGGQLAGFLGVLLAVPAAACIQEFVSDLQKGKVSQPE
ncbi:MAG TPA: AI-2E family transporter [Candidatus Paceibacterota bacterium]|nr:AI-2E family transporter [Candidatus Paceibacterota bacterium]